MLRDFGRHYLLECDAPSARANPKQTSLTSAPLSFRKASRAFPLSSHTKSPGRSEMVFPLSSECAAPESSATTNVAPQALQLPPVHEALPAPTQQMFDQSRT